MRREIRREGEVRRREKGGLMGKRQGQYQEVKFHCFRSSNVNKAPRMNEIKEQWRFRSPFLSLIFMATLHI